jgi:hypothetical protein
LPLPESAKPAAADKSSPPPRPRRIRPRRRSGRLITRETVRRAAERRSDREDADDQVRRRRESKFSYNDQTVISGVKEQAAGLATAAGSKVTVEYTGSGDSMVATKIKVTPKKMS